MSTPASSSSSVSVTSSNLPISLAALTNNFSTHLNSDNYLLWRDQITPLLICNDLYGHIDGSDPPPSKTIINESVVTPNPDYTRWFKIDQLVVGGIKNTLSSTACAEVLGKHVAKDVWDTLETLFHQQTLSRADILHDTLLDTYKNDMSIEAYLAKIKGIADQLATISQPVPDSELVKRTLRGLPHTLEYQPFAQGIANRHTPITFTELRARLLVHEQELERIRGRAAPPLSSPSHHAFVTQQHYQQSSNPHHGNYRRFNRPKQGTVSQNFGNSSASILGQYPTQNSPSFADFSNKSFNNNGQHGRNRFQNGNNYGNRPQFGRSRYRGRCQICKQEGHSASNCNYRYTRSDSTNSDNLSAQFAGVHVSDLTAPIEGTLDCVSPHWLGDTSATNHMASNTDLVQQPLPFNGTSGVYVGNGASLSISHIGNSSINLGSKSLSLKDILVVPQLKENLISIAKLTKDNYCVFACFPWGFVIKDLATGVILLKGPVKDNLYPIPAHALSAAFRKLSCHSAIARTAKIAPCSTWHRRLGHPGSKILQQLSVMPSVASQPAAIPSPAATKTPLAIVFEPLLSHSSSMNDCPTTSTCHMAPSSSATPTTSTADFSPVLSSTACAPPDQPALPSTACVPTPPPAAITSNNHPMITRAKDGIRKPRALCVKQVLNMSEQRDFIIKVESPSTRMAEVPL
ncbi:hypothetical protein POTOM_034943 [Populus tomentosa]|uniref:Retrovirus-related Pol polyprotein from transposon TNT 1-94-like beta-barrel domain-containing protein n=1 Tax=Populus tomentosa TaxID=118781 RepID=A0A8X7YZR1_POPTO|nr:hypothetical protein POTOM_034943 [Populus tomentosa]